MAIHCVICSAQSYTVFRSSPTQTIISAECPSLVTTCGKEVEEKWISSRSFVKVFMVPHAQKNKRIAYSFCKDDKTPCYPRWTINFYMQDGAVNEPKVWPLFPKSFTTISIKNGIWGLGVKQSYFGNKGDLVKVLRILFPVRLLQRAIPSWASSHPSYPSKFLSVVRETKSLVTYTEVAFHRIPREANSEAIGSAKLGIDWGEHSTDTS